jgi:hypothetical protein
MGGSFLKTGRSGPSLYADGRSDAYFKPRWAWESGAGNPLYQIDPVQRPI